MLSISFEPIDGLNVSEIDLSDSFYSLDCRQNLVLQIDEILYALSSGTQYIVINADCTRPS